MIRHGGHNASGGATGRRAGSATETCGPGGNTAPETTLLSGYGVDTLRWADNVAAPGGSCCPSDFQRGLTRRAREQRRVGGHLRRCSPRGLGWALNIQALGDPTQRQSAGCQPGTSAADLAPSAGRLRGFWGISRGFRRGFRRAPALPKNSRAGVSNPLKKRGPEIGI